MIQMRGQFHRIDGQLDVHISFDFAAALRVGVSGQALVVTHSPQVAARADAHYRIEKAEQGESMRTTVRRLADADRREEIARMLSGAEITDAARAAADQLMGS